MNEAAIAKRNISSGSGASPLRVVSLIPAATEIVCALGLGDRLVARSHECDYPETVRPLPACTASELVDAPSREIDERIAGILERGLSLYHVDGKRLRALRPDVIVTQTQCEVCAVSFDDVQSAVGAWVDSDPTIVSLSSNRLADIFTDIERVAAAIGVAERGVALRRNLQQRMARVVVRSAALKQRPRVACIEWVDPLMAAGNWMPELVQMAGGDNVFGEAGSHAPRIDGAQLGAADPDVIVALPCGFGIERVRKEVATLTMLPEWSTLSAVTGGRVFLADGNQYFNRPGPRVAEALEIMAEMLHPEVFEFGHRGTGWELLPRRLHDDP